MKYRYTNWSATLVAPTKLATSTNAVASAAASYYSLSGLTAPAVASLTVQVQNTGTRASGVVIHVFASSVAQQQRVPGSGSTLAPPIRQLVGFTRLQHLAPRSPPRIVMVGLAPLALCVVASNGDQWVEPREWRLAATVDGVHMLNASLSVTGDKRRLLSWPMEYERLNNRTSS